MRMNRRQWVAYASILFTGPRKRGREKREKKEPRLPTVWQATLPGRRKPTKVKAHTRSEARARLKEAAGIPRKGRLPVSTIVDRAA